MFSIKTALGFAALLVTVLVAADLLNRLIGTRGVGVAAGVAGLADVHSSVTTVASFVASSIIDVEAAQIPLLIAITTNTTAKVAMAFANGTAAYCVHVIPGLLLTVVAVWLANQWF